MNKPIVGQEYALFVKGVRFSPELEVNEVVCDCTDHEKTLTSVDLPDGIDGPDPDEAGTIFVVGLHENLQGIHIFTPLHPSSNTHTCWIWKLVT